MGGIEQGQVTAFRRKATVERIFKEGHISVRQKVERIFWEQTENINKFIYRGTQGDCSFHKAPRGASPAPPPSLPRATQLLSTSRAHQLLVP